MSDCMNFPNNWHTFLNDYSFKDTQEIYTNGSNLISTFRVEQLIEHYFNMPSRDKAKWILSSFQDEEDNMNGNYHYECSNCGAEDVHSEHVHVPYCWHCGAKMDGEWRDEMRLIDADALKDEMRAGCVPIDLGGITGITGDDDSIEDYIDAMPTIDAIPVEWLEAKKTKLESNFMIGPRTAAKAIERLIRNWKDEQDGVR